MHTDKTPTSEGMRAADRARYIAAGLEHGVDWLTSLSADDIDKTLRHGLWWDRFFHAFTPIVFTTCWPLLHNVHATEEAMQNAWMNAHSKFDTFKGDGKALKAWLLTIALNSARAVARSMRVQQKFMSACARVAAESPVSDEYFVQAARIDACIYQRLHQLNGVVAKQDCVETRNWCAEINELLLIEVKQLRPEDADVARKKLSGLTDAQTAKVLELPLGTVKARWARVKSVLAPAISEKVGRTPPRGRDGHARGRLNP